MKSVPGAVATGSQRIARIDIPDMCCPVATAPGTDLMPKVGTLTLAKLEQFGSCGERRSGFFYVTIGAMMAKETQRAEILDGRAAAAEIKSEVAAEVSGLKSEYGVTPRLAAVLVGDDAASAVYVRNKIRACEEVGIASDHLSLPATTTTKELL